MTTKPDDLEAVRNVVAALEGFDADSQERIVRWAREKLNLPIAPARSPAPHIPAIPQQPEIPPSPTVLPQSAVGGVKDLKTFVTEKKPKNDVQFAAAVAYYYRFEAPSTQRKDEIGSDDLQEGCRLANRERFKHPGQTLRNAHTLGLLDKGSRSGVFAINSVGENLVAMTLPGGRGTGISEKTRTKRTRKIAKPAKKNIRKK